MLEKDIYLKLTVDVFNEVFNKYGISKHQIIGKSRAAELIKARHIMCAVLYKNGMPQTKIGKLLNRDHTSVLHAIASANERWSEEISSFKVKPIEITELRSPYGNTKSKKYSWLYKLYNGKCAICGFSDVIQVHHIIPRSIGGSDDITNLIVLCPNHHALLHLGMVDISELPTPKPEL